MKLEWQTPLVIETAVSPLRLKGEPPVFDGDGIIREATASFAAA
jgi:hypothetical protein